MTQRVLWATIFAVACIIGRVAVAADLTVVGTVVQVKDPEPGVDAARRTLTARSHDVLGIPIVGDPTQAGATVTFFVVGTSLTSQSFALLQGIDPTSGRPLWRASRNGFTYVDAHGVNGPVRSVRLRGTASSFDLKAVALGKLGPITLVPPAPGTSACVRVDVAGGDSYHLLFPPVPGVVTKNTDKAFVARNGPYRGFCTELLPPTSTTSTSTSTTTTSTVGTVTTTITTTTTMSVTTTTVDPSLCGDGIRQPGEECDGGPQCTAACGQTIPSCCKSADACSEAPLYSLYFYLSQYCMAFFPGSSGDPGKLCNPDGSCSDVPIAPVPVCCRRPDGTCFDAASETSTVGLWYFQNFCRGSATGTFSIGATCGGDGFCHPH